MKFSLLLIFVASMMLTAVSQSNRIHPADSIYYKSKSDSIDFKSTPVKTPADTSSYKKKPRFMKPDSIPMDDKDPKKVKDRNRNN